MSRDRGRRRQVVFHFGQREPGIVGGYRHVAHRRRRTTEPGCPALDRRNHRNLRTAYGFVEAKNRCRQRLAHLDGVFRCGFRRAVGIAAETEIIAHAGKRNRLDIRIASRVDNQRREIIQHLQRQHVALFRSVDGQTGDISIVFQFQRVFHVSLPLHFLVRIPLPRPI